MLNRQKAILEFLAQARRPVSRLELTKWCFLLAHEGSTGGGNAFYEFVPYHYGPFSFVLYRDTDKLVKDGFVSCPDDKTWALVPSALTRRRPAVEVRTDISAILLRFGQMRTDELLSRVYQDYPWWTVKSKKGTTAQLPSAKPAIYTAGYAGLTIDGFLNMLLEAGIRCIADVRSNPVARRYGFHKSTLSRLAGMLEIDYLHWPELGVASEHRRHLETFADYERLFAAYEAETIPGQTAVLGRLGEAIREQPTVLVCAETDPRWCHRSRLAKALGELTGMPVEHLGGNLCARMAS